MVRRHMHPMKVVAIMADLRTRKWSDSFIAGKNNVSQPPVSGIRKRMGLQPLKIKKLYRKMGPKNQQITNNQRKLIIGLLKRGDYNDRRIAKRAGVNPDTVLQWRNKIKPLGLPAVGGQISRHKARRIIQLRIEGKTLEEIRKKEGASLGTINRILDNQEKYARKPEEIERRKRLYEAAQKRKQKN